MASKASRSNPKKGTSHTPPEIVTAPTDAKRPISLMLTVLPLMAALFTTGTVLLHALGAITHRTFLNRMGVPSDLFPKDVAWTLINGYYALFDRWFLLFRTLFDEPLSFLGYGFGFAAAVLIFTFALRWNPKGWEQIEHWPTFAKVALRFLSLTIGIVGMLPGAICAVLLAILAVGAPGELAAQNYIDKLHERYESGCTPEAECTIVLREGTEILRGAVLDSSANHIAIYEPVTKLSHVLEMKGTELRSSVRAAKSNASE